MKVLIFGASGMIGHRVWLEAKALWGKDVFGVIRKPMDHFDSYQLFNENVTAGLDVNNWNEVETLLAKIKPDVIVNALGITIRKPEMAQLEVALAINSFFPRRLLKWAQANNSRVIHFSTDCVFDGGLGHYSELSQPSAQDHYGKTKFLGEIEGPRALTLRFSCIGRELDSHTELLDWFLAQRGKKIKGFSQAMYSGLTTTTIAREVCRIIKNFPALEGVFQLSSEPISKYDLLCLAKDHFRLDVDIEKFDNYVSDKTLVCDKYQQATGFRAASWAEMMRDVASDERINYKIF